MGVFTVTAVANKPSDGLVCPVPTLFRLILEGTFMDDVPGSAVAGINSADSLRLLRETALSSESDSASDPDSLPSDMVWCRDDDDDDESNI